jgi:NTP pyrophosphatase (non-canonical NTP hydrolase)
MEENKVLEQAIAVFGERAQEDIAIEEMSELTQAILHNRRGRASNIPEEIADVLIAVEQLIMIHDCCEEVNGIKYHKLMRLQENIFDKCL